MGVHERLSLDAVSEHTLTAVEHRHRYAFARTACEGRRVLDLCCGVGYGSGLMAEVADHVVGVDRDAAAVDTAQATVGARTGASFVIADALDYLRALQPGDFDLVVCLQCLERRSGAEEVVAQLARLVAGGAGMIASVPNAAMHVTGFDLLSAQALFAAIPETTLAFQTHAEGSLIRGRAAGAVTADIRVEGEQDLDSANVFLAIAGLDADVVLGASGAALNVAVAPINHRYMRNLEQANRSLGAANARLARERLGLGAAGAASSVLRREGELEAARADQRRQQGRVEALEAEAASLRTERDALRAERDDYRRAHVVVHASRLTNLAARLAGHRFIR